MARSQSSVRRWLEELRYETESYDPHMQMQQTPDATSTVAWRYARASWSPQITVTETTTAASELPDAIVVDMPSSRVDTITNKVRNVIAQNEERIHHLESNEPSQENHRNRLATVSVPPNTVSNNVKRFHNTLLLPQQSQKHIKNEEIILRRAQYLQSGLVIPASIPQRPYSHNDTKQNSYLYKDQSVALPTMIREGPISRVKIMTATNKSPPKHWKTGMYALLTDHALYFFEDVDALLSMKSGAASTGVPSIKDRVDLRNGARIMQDTDRYHSTKRNVLAIFSRDIQIAALMQNDDQQLSDSWYRDISSVIAKHMKESDSPTGSGVSNTKSVLNWFFKKRPNKETLVNQGIYKNEPIFGNTLERLYEASDKKLLIPAFVVRCTEILENPPHVFSIGLYRTSGNLSHIQKLRLRVDQEDADALEDLAVASDSDVLAGALKLFFRELQIPLVPYQIYLRLSEACTQQDPEKRLMLSIDALGKLPQAHYQTLHLLCKHLLRITVYERQNQMSAANLGIVWGPSFTWPDEGTATRALHLCTDVNRVVQYLIEESGQLFQ